MPRVKRGVTKLKRRRNTLAQTKGYRNGRKSKEAQAKDAIRHAGAYAFAHRRDKKNDKRKLWTTKINASSKNLGINYSKFQGGLKKKSIGLNRKVLSQIAEKHPETFERIIKSI
jgi:large subunit ribosomal protein L20